MANAAIKEAELDEAEMFPEMQKLMDDMMAKGMSKEMALQAVKKKMASMKETTMVVLSEASQMELAEGGVVEVTIIRPGWSDNGNYYSPAVLAKAMPMFEGMTAYLNHPTKTELRERPGRDLRDLAGYYENVRVAEDGSLKGKLNLVGPNGDMLKSMIGETIHRKPDLVGISINAAGKTKPGVAEGKRGNIVEEIVSLHSSDIVTRPAAGGRFERLVASGDWLEEIIKEMTAEQIYTLRPELNHKEGNMTVEIEEQVKTIVEQQVAVALKPLQEELTKTKEALSVAKRRETAREKLKASDLPEAIHGDLMEGLVALEDEDQDKAIQAEVAKIKKLGIKPVIRGVGQGDNGDGPTLMEQTARKVLSIGSEFPKPDEDVWAYKERINKAAQA